MIFHPNCTLPGSSPVFVSAPNVRSTTEILWNCLSTVFLCTWSILFLNIPPQTKPKTKSQWIRKKLNLLWTKVKWMIITLMAPEFIMGLAASNFWSARSNNKTLKILARDDGVDWSIAHTFYADMGGFVIQIEEPSSHQAAVTACDTGNEARKPSTETPPPTTFNPTSEELTGDLSDIEECPSEAVARVASNSQALSSSVGVQSLSSPSSSRKLGPPTPGTGTLHNITPYLDSGQDKDANTAEQSYFGIVDRKDLPVWGGATKMDKLAKLGTPAWKMDLENRRLVAAFRSSSEHASHDDALFLQGNIWVPSARQLAIARERGIIRRLPQISEDELGDKDKGDYLVKSLALLQIVWMLVQLLRRWSNKRPVSQLEVMTFSFATCAVIIYALILPRPQGVDTPTVVLGRRASLDEISSMNCVNFRGAFSRRLYTMPNDVVHHQNSFLVGAALGAISFGVLHLIAWDFTFPSVVEKMLWRVSSVITIVSPTGGLAVLLIGYWIWIDEDRKTPSVPEYMLSLYTYLATLVFILARLFLLVESFRSLYYQPIDVFKTIWAH